ncbi:MAG: hypothetical protein IJ228_14175 [Succinivibrio sp.]|nr:hypothetical protein [Succinivibrio sp.]
MNRKITKVCFIKADLDTMLAGFIMLDGVAALEGTLPAQNVSDLIAGLEITALKESAEESLLCDRRVLCLECGGSGRTAELNFDHHGEGAADVDGCAAQQAWHCWSAEHFLDPDVSAVMESLVEYTAQIDLGRGVPRRGGNNDNVTLAGLLSGMMYLVRGQQERFVKGLELLLSAASAMLRGRGACDNLREWAQSEPTANLYLQEKARRMAQLQDESASAVTLRESPYKVMALESALFGVHGLLRSKSADISVAGDGRGHISVASRPGLERVIARIQSALNELEAGWGGPVGGTIIGSPRQGSRLDTLSVAAVVCEVIG